MTTWNDYRAWLGDLAVGSSNPKATAPDISALATDTRTIAAGQWFVPISGENFDGHKFIEEAMRRGASGFFYDAARANELPAALLPQGLAVRDTLAAFQHAAAGWRLTLKDLKLLALTGSAGKTTTKEMLGQILKAAGPTHATQGSFNNEVGVPKTLQVLTPAHRYAALEFGARMPGNIRFLAEMAAPDVVGLLNVGVAHLGIFGSVENLLNTKLEIFRNSPDHAVQVANADDPRIVAGARGTGKKTLYFGTSKDADVRSLGSDWQQDEGTMTVKLEINGRQVAIPFGVAHEIFAVNAAAAAAMALAAGVKETAIVSGLSGFSGVKGRYQVHRKGGRTVIDDTYNANPDSMRVGLATVARAFRGHKLVLVLGDMLELGDGSSKEHLNVGKEYLRPLLDQVAVLVTVGKEAKQIAEGAVAAGLAKAKIKSFGVVDELLAQSAEVVAAGDVLYAKGSNGIKLGKLIDKLVN